MITRFRRTGTRRAAGLVGGLLSFLAAALLLPGNNLRARQAGPQLTPQEKAIMSRLGQLRGMSDAARGQATKALALEIRRLPASPMKVNLATGLANLSTEGDPGGPETLQEVTTTLAGALVQDPPAESNGQPAFPYIELASLVRYEHMRTSLDSPGFRAAAALLQQEDERRAQADFTLRDLQDKEWTLKDLHGKVVLVNFWATWCPPCRKEIPDLKALYGQFGSQGFLVLGIDLDEQASKVRPFVQQSGIAYPVLLDPGGKINKLYSVQGIPMSFLYDRDGKLVAEAMDMRTREQFLAMLAKAGLN